MEEDTVTAVISVSIKRCTWRRHWLVLLFFFLFPSFLSRWRQLFGGGSSLLLKRRKKKERENGLEKWTKTCTVCCAPVYTRHKTNWKLTAAIVVCSFLGNSQCCIVDLILPPETPTIAVYKTNVYIYIDPSGYITIRVVSEWSPEWVCFLLSILWFLFRFCVCTYFVKMRLFLYAICVCVQVGGRDTHKHAHIYSGKKKEKNEKIKTKQSGAIIFSPCTAETRRHLFVFVCLFTSSPFSSDGLFSFAFLSLFIYTHTHTHLYIVYIHIYLPLIVWVPCRVWSPLVVIFCFSLWFPNFV